MRILLLVLSMAYGAMAVVCPTMSMPTNWVTEPAISRAALNANPIETETKYNQCKDSINTYFGVFSNPTTALTISSLTDLIFRVDSDASGANKFVVKNSDLDTMLRINEDGTYKFFGAGALASPAITGTVSGGASYTAPTITSPAITGIVSGGASYTAPTLTGTVTNSGTISGGTVNPTTLQQGGVQAVTTTGTQTLTNKSIVASQITAGAFSAGDYNITGGLTATNNVTGNAIFGNGGRVRAYNAGGQGTYLELAKYQGALPGAPTEYLPVIKTDHTEILTVLAGKRHTSIFTGGWNELTIVDTAGGSADVRFRSNSQDSYIRTGRFGLGNDSPDSTLDITGSGNFSGNVRVAGSIRAGGNEPFTYDEGSFTANFSSGSNIDFNYVRIGKIVNLSFGSDYFLHDFSPPNIATGIPAAIRPSGFAGTSQFTTSGLNSTYAMFKIRNDTMFFMFNYLGLSASYGPAGGGPDSLYICTAALSPDDRCSVTYTLD